MNRWYVQPERASDPCFYYETETADPRQARREIRAKCFGRKDNFFIETVDSFCDYARGQRSNYLAAQGIPVGD